MTRRHAAVAVAATVAGAAAGIVLGAAAAIAADIITDYRYRREPVTPCPACR